MGGKGKERSDRAVVDQDAGLFADVARVAVEHVPGLVPGAVENSLAAVVSMAETQNPHLATALRGVLGAVVQYDPAPIPPPAQLINPPDTRIGGV